MVNKEEYMKVKIKKTHPSGKIPTYPTFDLYSAESVRFDYNETKVVKLGVKMEIPEGHVLLLFPGASLGKNAGFRMVNGIEVIDSDYIGTISVLCENIYSKIDYIRKGDRIAKGIIAKIPKIEFEEVEELSTTERGDGGFGSTGV
jgi:dUTP diphosphatase|nr:MAG TPA: dUTPase [Caudoviricetes sp.]